LFKYVYKGHDCANIEFREKLSDGTEQLNRDEIRSYLDARYVSAPDTVANFSSEHSGTEKDQRGYPLCFKSKIFIFIMKSLNT
jgi:hypothetical protein